jgi:hypothetical protein
MLFEFVYGTLPFGYLEHDYFCVYQAILNLDLEIPKTPPVSSELIEVL